MKTNRNVAKLSPKLTDAEAKRLAKYIKDNGGQRKVGDQFSVAPETLSRTLNQHTAPSPMLRKELVGVGIVKE